jgi:hypothetical protein
MGNACCIRWRISEAAASEGRLKIARRFNAG